MKFLAIFSLTVSVAACKSTPPPAKSAKVDVHAHLVPDFYADALREAGHVPGPDGMPGIPVSQPISIDVTPILTSDVELGC